MDTTSERLILFLRLFNLDVKVGLGFRRCDVRDIDTIVVKSQHQFRDNIYNNSSLQSFLGHHKHPNMQKLHHLTSSYLGIGQPLHCQQSRLFVLTKLIFDF